MNKAISIGLILIILFCGCKSINVGGTGKVGNVSGSGSVSIPLPQQ